MKNVSNIVRSFRCRKRYDKTRINKRMENVISLPSFTSREPRPGEKKGAIPFYNKRRI